MVYTEELNYYYHYYYFTQISDGPFLTGHVFLLADLTRIIFPGGNLTGTDLANG